MVSFPENKITIAHAGVSDETVCRLSRLDTYTLPSLPDVAGLELTSEDELLMLNLLVDHIGALRKDINELKRMDCIN